MSLKQIGVLWVAIFVVICFAFLALVGLKQLGVVIATFVTILLILACLVGLHQKGCCGLLIFVAMYYSLLTLSVVVAKFCCKFT